MLLQKIFGKPIFFNNITVLFAIFSICILSNVKDNSNLSSGGGPMFDSNTYEHGAGDLLVRISFRFAILDPFTSWNVENLVRSQNFTC